MITDLMVSFTAQEAANRESNIDLLQKQMDKV